MSNRSSQHQSLTVGCNLSLVFALITILLTCLNHFLSGGQIQLKSWVQSGSYVHEKRNEARQVLCCPGICVIHVDVQIIHHHDSVLNGKEDQGPL